MSPQNATAIYFSKRFSILVVISEEVKSWITEAEKGIEVACSEDGVEGSVTEVVLKSGFALSVNKKKQFPDVLNKKKKNWFWLQEDSLATSCCISICYC